MKKLPVLMTLLLLIFVSCVLSADADTDIRKVHENVYRPSEMGINETKFSTAISDFLRYSSDVHDVLVIKDGQVIFEASKYPYIKNTTHGLMSCTKSVASILTGIAIEEGFIESVDTPLYTWFPELKRDPGKSKLTVYHLLSMTTGLDWNEDGGYGGTDSYMEMMRSDDPIDYFFSRRSTFSPGFFFEYNSGATAILGIILEKATGMDLLDYAESRLFSPLGIQKYDWLKMSTGTRNAASSLYLTPKGLGLIGLMMINDGALNGQQIVGEQWVKTSTEKIKTTPKGPAGFSGYGLSWWMNTQEGYSARGYGGQFLLCYPERNLVIVTTGGLYGNDFFNPDRILGNGILSALDEPVEDEAALKKCYELFTEPPKRNFRVKPADMMFLNKSYKFEDGSIFNLSESGDGNVFHLNMEINGNVISVKIPKDGTYVQADLGDFGAYEENIAMLAIGNLSEKLFELVIRRLHSMYIYRYVLEFTDEEATWTSYVSCFREAFEEFSGYVID